VINIPGYSSTVIIEGNTMNNKKTYETSMNFLIKSSPKAMIKRSSCESEAVPYVLKFMMKLWDEL
jgi:hypothetical protein